MCKQMNEALDFLRGKYGAPAGEIAAGGTDCVLRLPDGKTVELLPWRVERRFVELKKIIDDKTLEDVSTFRFASFSAGGDLKKMLMRELDLVEFLGSSPIRGVFAAGAAGAALNVLARLENGMSASIETGVKLPAGAAPLDRHEIIARRGVASDIGVDTQIPQSSIYEWTAQGAQTYTDVDTELYGLPNAQIWTVRAAFAVLSRPELGDAWNRAAARMRAAAEAAARADASQKPITL